MAPDDLSQLTAQTTKPEKYPNLFIAGFYRCGTTSLSKYLVHHPDICVPLVKEVYYFLDSTSPFNSMGRALFRTLGLSDGTRKLSYDFASFVEDYRGQPYILDATPCYYAQNVALEYACSNPDMKVIFMTRKPEERLFSSFRFFRNVYQEYPSTTYSEFVRALMGNQETREAYRCTISKPFFRALFDIELDMGRYETHLDRWVETLGRSRVFIGRLDDMRNDPRRFMHEVCAFLELDPAVYDTYDFKRYMKSFDVRAPLFQQLLRKIFKEDPMRYNQIEEYNSQFHSIKNEFARNLFSKLYISLQIQDSNRDTLDSKLGAKLVEYYLSSKLELLNRFNIDLLR